MNTPSPLCASCGRGGLKLKSAGSLGRVCSRCCERARAEPCVVCATVRPPRRRRPDGAGVCSVCVSRQLADASRDAKRQTVIDAVCRAEPRLALDAVVAAVDEACDITWRLSKVAAAIAADGDCLISGTSDAPLEMDRLAVALRAAGATSIAGFVCDECGATGRCVAVLGGKAVCERCGSRRRDTCARCARAAPVAAVWATGPVCSTCYQRVLASTGTCAACGRRRRIDPRDRSGQPLCSRCAGLPAMAVCAGCGKEDRIWRNKRCFGCNLSDRLDTLLAAADGSVEAPLSGLRQALEATGSPRAILRWLDRPEIEAVLVGMATGEIAVDHASVDALGPGGWVDHLRQVLVVGGVLAARDEAVAGLEQWIAHRLERIEIDDDRQIIATFATWWVLRRHRVRGARRPLTSVDRAHAVVNRGIDLLGWLRAHDKTLGTCTQPDIDLWIASGPPSRNGARDFLVWARRRRLCGDVVIVRRPQAVPVATAEVTMLAATAKRLMVDEAIALVDRVAGLLVICYAQPVSRIAQLSAERITRHDATVSLRLGVSDIELFEPLGELVNRLAAAKPGRAVLADPDSPWLFPGGHPGRPITADRLGIRLGRLGIAPKAARTAILLEYAGEVPPAVLADMLGLHPNTAVRWVRAAAGDWNAYAAERTRPA